MWKLVLLFASAAIVPFESQTVWHHGGDVVVTGRNEDCSNGSCHVGMLVPQEGVCIRDCEFKKTHAMSVIYPPAPTGFSPASALESAGVPLVDGRIGCVSCHDIRKNTKYQLTVPLEGNRLCMTCHII